MKKISVFICVMILVLSFAGAANAALIEMDRYNRDDGLITLDSITGLEWLDVTETLAMSYQDVWDDGQLSAEGWTHANNSELASLLYYYDENYSYSVDQLSLYEMQDFFGTFFLESSQPGEDSWITHGFWSINGWGVYGDALIRTYEHPDRGIWDVRGPFNS